MGGSSLWLLGCIVARVFRLGTCSPSRRGGLAARLTRGYSLFSHKPFYFAYQFCVPDQGSAFLYFRKGM